MDMWMPKYFECTAATAPSTLEFHPIKFAAGKWCGYVVVDEDDKLGAEAVAKAGLREADSARAENGKKTAASPANHLIVNLGSPAPHAVSENPKPVSLPPSTVEVTVAPVGNVPASGQVSTPTSSQRRASKPS
jgi:hypothetical protein